jgi:GT2 family glycosyltransferase
MSEPGTSRRSEPCSASAGSSPVVSLRVSTAGASRSDPPDVTATIVSWNTKPLLRGCLDALRRHPPGASIEVVVVDNASADGSPELVRQEFPEVRLIQNTDNVGFARAVNQAWPHASGRYWLLLNSDTEVGDGAIDALVAFMDRHPAAGLATARLLNVDGSPQHCAQAVPSALLTLLETLRLHKLLPTRLRGRLLLGPYFAYDVEQQVGWTWGTALICRRQAVEKTGLLAERFFLYGEDVDWCLRMRTAGWEVWFCPTAEVTHRGAGSAPEDQSDAMRRRLIQQRIFEALSCHRSRGRMAALHATSALSGGIEWLAARIRHRSATVPGETLRFHARAAGKLLLAGARHR